MSKVAVWIVSGSLTFVPLAIVTQASPTTFEPPQPPWKPTTTPPVGEVPVMLKIAVNKRPDKGALTKAPGAAAATR